MASVWFLGPERVVNNWRCTWPAAALREAGYDAHAVCPDGEQEADMRPGDTIVVHHSNQGDTFAEGRRRLATFLEIIRREVAPALLVVQWDDSYADLGDIQDVEGRGWYRAIMEDVAESARMADRIVVTTPYLAEVMGSYGTPVVVVPNYVARWVTELELPERLGDHAVWLGTLGGLSDPERGRRSSPHQHDWEWALRASVPDVPIRIVGVRSWQEHRWWQERLGSRYSHRRATFDLEALYRMVAEGCVGLAPVEPTLNFNRAKSWIKPLEYAALGLWAVTSSTEEYRRLDLDSVIRAGDPGGFWTITNDVRNGWAGTEREDFRKEVRENYTVEARVGEWVEALSL